MFEKIGWQNIVKQKTEYLLLIFFFAIRLLSLLTYHHPTINQIIALPLVAIFAYITIKDLNKSWLILVTELIIDGAGHFFELQGLILRTWFLGIFVCGWLIKKIREKKIEINLPRPLFIGLAAVVLTVLLASVLGFVHDHSIRTIFQDAILYLFVLLLFPALDLNTSSQKNYFKILMKVFVIGSLFFALISFVIYSAQLGHLPDTYYHWFRNVAAGKITDLGNHFFRIVLPEQLLTVPLIIVAASYLMREHKNKLLWALLICLLVILGLNFSRIYFLGLILGLIPLVFKNKFTHWLRISASIGLLFIGLFFLINFTASRFQSFGLETLGIRVNGQAQTEVSSAIRLAMLPDIFNTIKKHPFLGSGLATTVSYPDPITKEIVSRTQFDWGYFEMIAELGIIGTAIFIGFILTILYYLGRQAYFSPTNSPLPAGLFGGAISLFVINLTTPALFQGFGILYFVFLICVIQYGTNANPKISS